MTSGTVFTAALEERSVLAALCTVLHDKRELRVRLDDSGRVHRLAQDLESTRLKGHEPGSGIGPEAVDIHTALTRLGFTHPYTRPLTTQGLPTLAEVTDKVIAALASNPYRVGRAADREQVERIVSRDYLDVEPWPLAALVNA
jgi:hypothetical protein